MPAAHLRGHDNHIRERGFLGRRHRRRGRRRGAIARAVLLGTGLGFSAVSPWASEGISGTTAAVSTIIWITVVQLLASVIGGYLAGRLRTRWVTVHTNEVFFRDTAHGFLAWAVATLLMATLLSSAIGPRLYRLGSKRAARSRNLRRRWRAPVQARRRQSRRGRQPAGINPLGYFVDSLFRADPDRAAPASPAPQAPSAAQAAEPDRIPEVTRIFASALESGELAEPDRQYLGQLVAANTGLAQAEAEQRVTDTFTRLKQNLDQAAAKAKQVADDARKAAALLALWLVVSLLVGAFVASLTATFGGRLRDSSVLANT